MRSLATAAVLLLAVCSTPATLPEAATPELLSTWEPTPDAVVRLMLAMAEADNADLLYDLGSGDGRIVIAAAQQYRVQSLGLEIDAELVATSREEIAAKGLTALARVEARDLMTADFSLPDVITCYLTPEGLEKVTPKLEEQMKPGARLVAYKFPLPGWKPERIESIVDPDPEIPLHEVFLYRK